MQLHDVRFSGGGAWMPQVGRTSTATRPGFSHCRSLPADKRLLPQSPRLARPPDSQDIYSWHSASVTHRSGASGGVHGSAAGERLALGRVYLGIEQNGGLVVERWPGRRNHPATGGQHRKSRLGAGRGGRLDTCRGTVTHTADTTASRLSTALLHRCTAAFYLTIR